MAGRIRRTCCWQYTLAVIALCSASALGMWAPTQSVPVSRLVKNLSAYVEEHPRDASGHYALARVHSMAYVLGTSALEAHERDGEVVPSGLPGDKADPRPGPNMVPWQRKPEDTLDRAGRLHHLGEAITSFENALRSDRTTWGQYYPPALGHLSYAYLLEQGAVDAVESPAFPSLAITRAEQDAKSKEIKQLTEQLRDGAPKEQASACMGLARAGAVGLLALWENRDALAEVDVYGSTGREYAAERFHEYWFDLAADHYLKAHEGALKKDLAERHALSHSVRALVSYEAGTSYLRLALDRLPEQRKTFERVNDNLKRLEKEAQVGGAITPIIFPLDAPRPLESLLDDDTFVSFDLDGTGRDQRWPWVRPDTAILCWDPAGAGEIKSGRQLFGSVTWWVLFPDGYRALDALDDNRDGELAGSELTGLAVWRDSNSNGRSDSGEVQPVEAVGIKAISVRSDTSAGSGPACHSGVRLSDGRELPTYDWIVSPVNPDSATDETVATPASPEAPSPPRPSNPSR